MIELYTAATPNGWKLPIALEELGIDYEPDPTRQEFEACANDIFAMVASGKIKITVNQRFAPKNAAKAHRALEARATTESSILTI